MDTDKTKDAAEALDVRTGSSFEPPHTKDIEFCENRGCAFNANTGKCSSTCGQCYGYFPPNVTDQTRAAARGKYS